MKTRRNTVRAAALAVALWLAAPLPAADEQARAKQDELLDEVLVSGEQPGPAMWRVSKDGHTMWIMGTLAPLPAKMTWRSKQVEDVVRRAGEIMGNTSAHTNLGTGFFGTLRLIPAVLRLRNNADGATLQQALPQDLYARWSAQYRRYFGRDPDPKEKWRPLFAADELYRQALKKSGLTGQSPVWPTVERLAKRHKVHIRERRIDVPVKDPRDLIAALAEIPREREIDCLVLTLDYIDRELPNIRRRAAAWATGDLATLRALPPEVNRTDCASALVESLRPQLKEQVLKVRGDMDADRAGIFSWMLLTHGTSFTAMPIERLLRADDLVARWRAAGYTVEEPQ